MINVEPYMLNTAGGLITINEEIKVQFQALGAAAEPLQATVNPGSNMNLLSLGKMVLQEGFSFCWENGKQPHLVTPDGKHLWLEIDNNCPVLTTGEMLVNKVNELEAYERINAARSLPAIPLCAKHAQIHRQIEHIEMSMFF